jgi:endonuclease III
MKKLIQEIYREDPWKMLMGCIMLNLTNNVQVHPIIGNFFEKYPNPEAVIQANINDIVEDIRTLGLYNRRAKNMQNFSHDWLYKDWSKITECRGIGKYASDSYEIFINGNRSVSPTDKVLIGYLTRTA